MKEISSLDLRKKFGEVLDEVRYRKEPYIVKKNGRQIVVLMDIDVYKASQEHFKEEAFIEEYSEERIKEFLQEDNLDPSVFDRVKKTL
ncbi:MAG: type II toxin-antitoxin system Phd/YefM family antitoxin [Candidatus Omnitrophica bacterium]|nr:type II toxin-antitoxin system Phd/YefM family antitoxin [Candidatus Omnitrophota bacterium]